MVQFGFFKNSRVESNSSEFWGSSEAVGPSERIKGKFFKIIFASATRCASPPDNSNISYFKSK